MTTRIGELLVELGAINGTQRDEALQRQKTNGRPLGVIMERDFGVDRATLDKAWAEQYATLAQHVHPTCEKVDEDVQQLVTKRQAWQFGIVPLRREDRSLGEVLVCTTKDNLTRALRFVYRHIGPSAHLVICDRDELVAALERFYPLAGAREALAMQPMSR